MLKDLIAPVSKEEIERISKEGNTRMSAMIHQYSPDQDLDSFDIALIGVNEDRGAFENQGCNQASLKVRENFYQLYAANYSTRIVDLGTLKNGQNLYDTYAALKIVIEILLKEGVLPIIIGGGQDLTYGQYMGYEHLEKQINVAIVDELIDLNEFGEHMDSSSFMLKLLLHQPYNLYNLIHLGHQNFLNDRKAIDTLKKLNFDSYSLGDIRNNLMESEPMIRDADMLSFDIGSVSMADAPGRNNSTPNGFTAYEACAICRYAGISDKLSSVGFYEHNPSFDNRGQTAQLMAQMIWNFVDGYYSRKKDYPMTDDNDYIRYLVPLKDSGVDLVFRKSKKSDRWWMELTPENEDNKENLKWVPCSYSDYELAMKNEIPERWVRALEKMK